VDIEHLYRTVGLAEIQRFVDEGREEQLHLDFKIAKGASLRSDDDKRNLARALSGFANSSGGVVVWGVDARKGADEIDRARALVPIDPVAQFLSRLNELTGAFVEPLVAGVEHRIVLATATSGFALSLIPESASGPHMAKAGDDRYYKRSGDSFYRMEHFDIADMFGRRRRPELSVSFTLRSDGSMSSGGVTRHHVRVLFSILNTGRGSAIAPYVAFTIRAPYQMDRFGIDGNGTEGLPRVPTVSVGQIAYGGTSSIVIHPGTRQDVCAVRVDVVDGGPDPVDVNVEYTLTAQEIRLSTGLLTIPGSELANLVRKGIPSTGA